jgi:hypothetical protein
MRPRCSRAAQIGILALASMLLLSGCATEEKYRQLLAGTIGMPEQQLVMRFGAPTSTYETGGSRYLTYRQDVSYYQYDDYPYMYGNFGELVPTNPSGHLVHRGCDTTFQVTDGKVVAYNFTGNSCLAK